MLAFSSSTLAKADNIHILINGHEIITDVPPQMIGGSVMIPAKFIAEPLGAKAKWDEANKAVIIYESEKQQISAAITKKSVGSDIRIFINGEQIRPDVLPKMINGLAMIPAKQIAETLGANVSWDKQGQKLIINRRDVESKKSSNQITYPFSPTDIFFTQMTDWNNKDDLAMVKKTHSTVVGHGELDYRLQDFYDNTELISTVVDISHKTGLKYTALYISDNNIANATEMAVRDINGKIVYDSMQTETPRICNSIHYPQWKNYLIDLAKKTVDTGADIICFDCWTSNYDIIYKGGDFSENSMIGFTNYLGKKYNKTQLKGFRIDDINTFNYGKYIKNNYLKQYNSGDKGSIPLFHDFEDFQLESSKIFYQDLITEMQKYSETKGKKVLITVNAPESDHTELIKGLPIADVVDGFMSEYTYKLPPYNNTITEYKIFRSLGKPQVFIPNCGRSIDLTTRTDLPELMRIYTAEAYASGEFAYVPNAINMNSSAGWQLFKTDMTKLYPYYNFIYNNKSLYNNTVSTAKTAVLYSYASFKNKQSISDSFFGICNLLLDTHCQYDVLFAGDNRWINDKLILDELNKYDVIIMPNVRDISDKQLDLLLNYVKFGGKVFAFGETGINDESGNFKKRSQLNGLVTEGPHQYGLGQFVYEKDDAGAKYLNNKNSIILKKVTGIKDGLNQESIKTNASQKVAFLEYWNKSVEADIIHLVNYDYDTKAKHINRQKSINVNVTLNRKLLGKNLGVFYVSPDWSDTKELKYSIANNKMSFVVPLLDTYGVIFIGEKPAIGKKYDNTTPTPIPTPTPTPAPMLPTTLLPAPIGLSVSIKGTCASLAWLAVTGAVSYNVYYKKQNGSYNVINTETAKWLILNLSKKTQYYFKVTAINSNGEGEASTEIAKVTD